MSSIAIRVANLAKLYHIGRGQGKAGYRTLRESMMGWAKAPLRWFSRDGREAADETIWALKDVSFEVKRGEVVGIIGRNGAGKSTLLKILSRITEPTEGTVDLYGRVGSLLEVGTGFHPELTGRENIYLNGAILGMKRTEIIRKFDEIVDFSEIEKFLDTPVKHYSSGMYVRLAFAVAAHLDPEILLVDEVLAVGDAEFQKKCLGKMGDVAKGGITVLYISHDMAAIMRLCPRTILLEKGRIDADGMSEKIVAKYILGISGNNGIKAERVWSNMKEAPGDDTVRLLRIRLLDQIDVICGSISMDKDFFIELDYRVLAKISMSVGFQIVTTYGTVVFRSTDWDIDEISNHIREPGLYRSRCRIPAELLNEGRFTLSWIMDDPGRKMIKEHDLIGFEVKAVKNIGGKLDRQGVIRLRLPWQTEKLISIDSQ